MESRLIVDGSDSAAELMSLSGWLRRADELRGRVRLIPATPAADRMGSVFDVLAVAVGAGGAVTALANSLSVWLRQPRRAKVTVVVVRPDGTRVSVTGDTLRSVAELDSVLRLSLHADQDQAE